MAYQDNNTLKIAVGQKHKFLGDKFCLKYVDGRSIEMKDYVDASVIHWNLNGLWKKN